MNVCFEEKEPDVVKIKEKILVDGVVVGEVVESCAGGSRFHACLKVPRLLCYLLQGYGGTKEEALLDALRRGRSEANAALQYIDDIEGSG